MAPTLVGIVPAVPADDELLSAEDFELTNSEKIIASILAGLLIGFTAIAILVWIRSRRKC